MIRIGILGDIGSGKSYVANNFGYPVFNADDEVKFIYKKNKECFNKLKKKLPKFIKTFPIKKKELILAISFNKKNLKIISSVVHPLVRKKFWGRVWGFGFGVVGYVGLGGVWDPQMRGNILLLMLGLLEPPRLDYSD